MSEYELAGRIKEAFSFKPADIVREHRPQISSHMIYGMAMNEIPESGIS